MASGTSPSAAEETLRTTVEKANFQRLTWLLMRGGLALLRDVFDTIHRPANLPAVLSAKKVHLQTLKTTTGTKSLPTPSGSAFTTHMDQEPMESQPILISAYFTNYFDQYAALPLQ